MFPFSNFFYPVVLENETVHMRLCLTIAMMDASLTATKLMLTVKKNTQQRRYYADPSLYFESF